jgi:acyl carrier protein
MSTASEAADHEQILNAVVDVLHDMTSDWDLELSGGINASSQLVHDLQCESLDIVMLIVALEARFGVSELPWGETLLADGEVVEDITVREIADFLAEQLSRKGDTP